MIFNMFYMFTKIPDDKIVSGGAKLSGNSSQNDQFFKTVPARLGAQKEKYIPLRNIKVVVGRESKNLFNVPPRTSRV